VLPFQRAPLHLVLTNAAPDATARLRLRHRPRLTALLVIAAIGALLGAAFIVVSAPRRRPFPRVD
jgi:hypothetical protein